MKVLQLHNFAMGRGGIENVIASDTRLLRGGGSEVERFSINNADVKGLSNVRAGMKAIWNVQAHREVKRLIDEFQPDVAHVYTPFPIMSPAVFRAASRMGVPTVVTVQSYRYSCVNGLFYRNGQVCELCLGKRFKVAGVRYRCYHESLLGSGTLAASLALHSTMGTFRDHIDVWLVNSEFMRQKLGEEGISTQKIVVKPNTTPDPGYTPGVTGNHAIFAGRLEREKGIPTLLAAWASNRGLPSITILGDGPLRSEVEQAAQRDPRITYRGWLDHDEVQEELRSARFMILCSEWYEGQPVIALESFSCGTPIIASDVGNFSEMVMPGENGFRFESGSVSSLTSVVEQAWRTTDPSEIAALRERARNTYLVNHSEEKNRVELHAAYSRAIYGRSFGCVPERL